MLLLATYNFCDYAWCCLQQWLENVAACCLYTNRSGLVLSTVQLIASNLLLLHCPARPAFMLQNLVLTCTAAALKANVTWSRLPEHGHT